MRLMSITKEGSSSILTINGKLGRNDLLNITYKSRLRFKKKQTQVKKKKKKERIGRSNHQPNALPTWSLHLFLGPRSLKTVVCQVGLYCNHPSRDYWASPAAEPRTVSQGQAKTKIAFPKHGLLWFVVLEAKHAFSPTQMTNSSWRKRCLWTPRWCCR